MSRHVSTALRKEVLQQYLFVIWLQFLTLCLSCSINLLQSGLTKSIKIRHAIIYIILYLTMSLAWCELWIAMACQAMSEFVVWLVWLVWLVWSLWITAVSGAMGSTRHGQLDIWQIWHILKPFCRLDPLLELYSKSNATPPFFMLHHVIMFFYFTFFSKQCLPISAHLQTCSTTATFWAGNWATDRQVFPTSRESACPELDRHKNTWTI
jgi:hypothetical protein